MKDLLTYWSLVRILLYVYLLMYKSTPHSQGQKSDFSSFLVKVVKFSPIEISQKS